MSSPELSVIVPCRDEEENVARFPEELYPALEALGTSWELVAVDDGSVDGTRSELARLAEARPGQVRVLARPAPGGLGAALRDGLQAARGEWLAVLDADLTFSPSAIALLRARQGETGADCVCGTPWGEGMSEVPWPRRAGSWLVNRGYRILWPRCGLTSFTGMFRLYRAQTLRGLTLESRGFEVNPEIVLKLLAAGRRVCEVPVPLGTRRRGRSKMSPLRELAAQARIALRLRF